MRAGIAYLGLGSNEGDRLEHLRSAVDLLAATEGIEVLRRSSVYETEPVGEVLEQRAFYNAALEVDVDLEPRELLDACKRAERQLGREPGGIRHGPRPIDVDVLLFGGLQIVDEQLVVPHPQLATRRFVLVPLLELEPDLGLPGGQSLDDALAALGDRQRVARVGGWS